MVDLLGQSDFTHQQMFSVDAFFGLVEFRPGFVPRRHLSPVLFGFDGTGSFKRHGWPEPAILAFREADPLFDGIFGV